MNDAISLGKEDIVILLLNKGAKPTCMRTLYRAIERGDELGGVFAMGGVGEYF